MEKPGTAPSKRASRVTVPVCFLVYGTGDDNCHYQNCEALINELIAHGKQFEMMAYPGRTHGISEGKGTRKHLFTRMTSFLLERLPPGPVR